MWEFSRIRGTLFWCPHNKGSPIFGNSHVDMQKEPLLEPVLQVSNPQAGALVHLRPGPGEGKAPTGGRCEGKDGAVAENVCNGSVFVPAPRRSSS